MSEDELLSALISSKPIKKSKKNFDDTKPKINFSKARIEKIRKEFNKSRYRFFKSKINEIRRNLYEIENEKNLFAPKIKETRKNFLELEENLFKPKKYYDYDDTEYQGIRDVKDLSIDEDYYKPIITNSAFNNNYYCYVEMPEGDNKILKYNHREKSMKVPFTIYADWEPLLEKTNTFQNNPEKSSTTKINKHTPSGYSLFTHCSFDTSKNKFDYYRGKNFLKNFCLDLKEHATKIIDYEKEEMIPLTKKEEKMHNKQNVCYTCKKRFSNDDGKTKYFEVNDHCHYTGKCRGSAHDISNLKYEIPKEISVVFRNGSIYDYHFIIKELAQEFEGEFECLGENTAKYTNFSLPIKKEITKIDRDGNDKIMKISSKI